MVKPLKQQKSKRKRGKKFVYNSNQLEEQNNLKKTNPFEEFSRKNHMKIGNQYDNLIKEYNQRYNSNTFIDKRIGEGSKALTEDEKMQLRFKSVQKTKSSKKSKFDINSDSDNELNNLTHKGKNLKEIDDYNEDNDILSEAESDQENRQKSSLNYLEEIDKNPNLSRKEIIQNMIMNSKKEKLEKQRTKEINREKIQKLDDEFTDLLDLVQKRKKTILRSSDPYDKYAASLLYAKRTKPTDRVKSEEELALEKKTMLEKLEKERLSRLKNTDMDQDDEGNEADEDEHKHPDKIDINLRTLTKKERIEKLIQKRLSKSNRTEDNENLIERKRERENNEEDDQEDGEDEDEQSEIDDASDLNDLDEMEENEEFEDDELDNEEQELNQDEDLNEKEDKKNEDDPRDDVEN